MSFDLHYLFSSPLGSFSLPLPLVRKFSGEVMRVVRELEEELLENKVLGFTIQSRVVTLYKAGATPEVRLQ